MKVPSMHSPLLQLTVAILAAWMLASPRALAGENTADRTAHAATPGTPAPLAVTRTGPAPGIPASIAPPGVAAAQALSEVTGIAISPLFGVGAVGAWKYYHTAEGQRSRLPWFARPWFWAPALFLVGICFLKDALGPALTPSIKKPLDVLEVFENKLSGLLATGAIVPLLWTVLNALEPSGANLADAGLGTLGANAIPGLFLVPLGLAAYAVVFLVSHAVNVLILFSPFTTVDAVLKLARTAVLGSVVASSALHPYLGAFWAILIIVVAAFLAPWALRLLVFGHVLALDIALLRHRTSAPRVDGNPVFLARRLGSASRRTFGRIVLDATGHLAFEWRPFLVLRPRRVQLPSGRYEISRGVLHPSLQSAGLAQKHEWAWFPPRFRGHEARLTSLYGLSEVRDTPLRAAWEWVRSLGRRSLADRRMFSLGAAYGPRTAR